MTQGERTFSFTSFRHLVDTLNSALPDGVTYNTKVQQSSQGDGAIYNVLFGEVMLKGVSVWNESVAMPLYQNPFDASGAITMLKKALIMSMFELIPEEGQDNKMDLTPDVMKALVKVASEEGLPAAINRGNKAFNMTQTAIDTLRKAAKAKKNGKDQ